MKRTLIIIAALWAGVACGAVEIPSGKGFDASEVPAYGGEHTAIYAHIDAHQAEHLENLRRWVRQPSVSALNIGIEEMAKLLAGAKSGGPHRRDSQLAQSHQ